MRIQGFRIECVGQGVELWELSTVEMRLEAVIEHRYVSAQPSSRLSPCFGDWGRPDPRFDLEAIGPLCVRGADGEHRLLEGLIVAQTSSAATTFVLNSYEPVADRALDELLRRARREEWPEADLRDRIERQIVAGVQLADGARGWIPVSVREGNDDETPFGDQRYLGVDLQYRRLEFGAAKYALLCVARESPLVLALPREADVGGRRVARREYVALRSPLGGPVLWWDGERMNVRAHFEDLPAALREAFDRQGVALAEVPAPALGGVELRPHAVLEFPAVGAMAAAGERLPAEAGVLRPALLFDSRGAVPLRSDLPVIRDPGELRYIMSRVVRGAVFLPTASRARDMPMEPGCPFAVLAVPGRAVSA